MRRKGDWWLSAGHCFPPFLFFFLEGGRSLWPCLFLSNYGKRKRTLKRSRNRSLLSFWIQDAGFSGIDQAELHLTSWHMSLLADPAWDACLLQGPSVCVEKDGTTSHVEETVTHCGSMQKSNIASLDFNISVRSVSFWRVEVLCNKKIYLS